MNKYEIYTRVNHESFENVPRLPVYLRSVGYKKLQNGTLEKSTELHSPFFEMIWCKRGVGEVFLYKESFPLLANDIFFITRMSSTRSTLFPMTLKFTGQPLMVRMPLPFLTATDIRAKCTPSNNVRSSCLNKSGIRSAIHPR